MYMFAPMLIFITNPAESGRALSCHIVHFGSLWKNTVRSFAVETSFSDVAPVSLVDLASKPWEMYF